MAILQPLTLIDILSRLQYLAILNTLHPVLSSRVSTMAEEKVTRAQAPVANTGFPSLNEKRVQVAAAPIDDEDEDIDALIEDLESEDGHHLEEEEMDAIPGGGCIVPENMLQTDSLVGLTEAEVVARRRKYGLNQMKEEKENLILKFLMFFVGPIQFVMEVSSL